jgi:CheY-like chemotaxis protein
MKVKPGLLVSIADNGKEGVDKVRADAYDVVHMDMQIPEMGNLSRRWGNG